MMGNVLIAQIVVLNDVVHRGCPCSVDRCLNSLYVMLYVEVSIDAK